MSNKIARAAEELARHGVPAPVRAYYEAKGFRKGVRCALPLTVVATVAGYAALRHFVPEFEPKVIELAKTARDFIADQASSLLDQVDAAMNGKPAAKPQPAAAEAAQAETAPAADAAPAPAAE